MLGFLVAKTKDVIGLAKEVKGTLDAEKENGVKVKPRRLSIQESCILDVRIGNVSILAVGYDSSILAATVGGEIRVYSVNSLVKKVFFSLQFSIVQLFVTIFENPIVFLTFYNKVQSSSLLASCNCTGKFTYAASLIK